MQFFEVVAGAASGVPGWGWLLVLVLLAVALGVKWVLDAYWPPESADRRALIAERVARREERRRQRVARKAERAAVKARKRLARAETEYLVVAQRQPPTEVERVPPDGTTGP